MDGFLWANSHYGPFTFILITLVLGGAGAWATGRAIAKTWRPMAMVALYMIFLTAGGALPALRALWRAAAVAEALHRRLHLDDGGRRARLPVHAGDADGDPIFLGLRAFGAELARQRQWLNIA